MIRDPSFYLEGEADRIVRVQQGTVNEVKLDMMSSKLLRIHPDLEYFIPGIQFSLSHDVLVIKPGEERTLSITLDVSPDVKDGAYFIQYWLMDDQAWEQRRYGNLYILVGDGEPIIVEDKRAIFSFYFRNPDGNIVEARSGTDVSLEKWERLLALED